MKEKKRILISGGTSGFGLALAEELASSYAWEIILCAKDVSKGNEILDALKKNHPLACVYFFPVDLGDFTSIETLLFTLQTNALLPLDILINSAAIQSLDPDAKTAQGYHATFGINHLGTFVLSYRLLPFMRPNASIVTLSSNTHIPYREPLMPNPHFSSPHQLAFGAKKWWMPAWYWGARAYTTSKLCNVLFTYALQEHLDVHHPSLSACAFDPGMMPKTNLLRSYPLWIQWLYHTLTPYFKPLYSGISSPKRSASALIKHLTSLESLKGAYLNVQGKCASSKDSYKKQWQKSLWEFSLLEYEKFIQKPEAS